MKQSVRTLGIISIIVSFGVGLAGQSPAFSPADSKELASYRLTMEKSPQAMAALAKAGLTPREYTKYFVASLMAGMVAGFQKAGTIKDLPKELKEIHPDNIKFILEHEAELTAMQKELQGASKGN